MHTKLPEFIEFMRKAAAHHCPGKQIEIRGLENVTTCNMQSLRTGRIESAVDEIAAAGDTASVELVVMPRVPETMHTVIVKGLDEQGRPTRAILEVINIIHPTEEVELADCPEVDDRRPALGKH